MKLKTIQITAAVLLMAQSSAMAQSFWLNHKTTAKVILTNAATGEKFADKGVVNFNDFRQPKETDVCIFADPAHRYQKLVGMGGALTDAAAETFAKLPKAAQTEVLEAYFGRNGIGYTMARTSMNSSDFSSDSYTYVKDGDAALKSFDISHDLDFKIPLIRQAQNKVGKDFKLFFAPWSPPAWMKSNQDMLHGGSLKREFYQAWADYYVKFIQEYERRGLPIWGLSIQNEPMATQKWESCIYTADEEADFLKNNLGPTLWKNGYKDKKIFIWDHNRDLMYQRAITTLADPETSKYAAGIAYHWYETWTKSQPLFSNVAETRRAFPDKVLFFTEGCKELFDYSKKDEVGLGELYGANIINDFNNGTAAWADWNILLDETGGPNHAGNFCFAPIIADTKTGQLHYTFEYYYIGHVSKYIHPGAVRLGSTTNRDFLLSTTFMNPDGSLASIIMNQSDNPAQVNYCIQGRAAKLDAPAHSIQTVIL